MPMTVTDLRGAASFFDRVRAVIGRERALVACLGLAALVAFHGRLAVDRPDGFVSSVDGLRPCEVRAAALSAWPKGEHRPFLSWRDEAECLPIPEADTNDTALARELDLLLSGTPMHAMIPELVSLERPVAAFIVAIAKKESNWGKRVPTKDGIDCYNYWGFKSQGTRGTALGHACFGSREEAVERVSSRIRTLVYEARRDTPGKMVIWKCGSSCAWDRPENVARWIRDVALYYHKVMEGSAG